MAEQVGHMQCTHRDCNQGATIYKDKRGKYFLDCPIHGRMTYNRLSAQVELKKLLDAGEGSEEVNGVILGVQPEQINQADQVDQADQVEVKIITSKSEIEADDHGEREGTFVPLLIGIVLGVITWVAKQKKPSTKSTFHPIE